MRRIALVLGWVIVVAGTTARVAVAAPHPVPQDTTKGKKKGDGEAKAKKPPRTPAEDSARIVKRGEQARALPLFASKAPLPFTLVANFGKINRDRDSLSTTRYPGTLVVADEQGAERRIPVKLRTRGHYRLQKRVCNFVNLLVQFPDSGLKGTPFQGQKSLKLGGHCQSDQRYEDNLMKEYLAYRVFNELTDRSFRVRLSKATYVDSANGKTLDTRVAMWLENEDDVAARAGGQIREVRGALFDDVEAETLNLVTLFEYAIGNTDYSIYALHNTRLAQSPTGVLYVLAYDFDFSGFVSAPYATPDPSLPIRSVRQRLYRGPCRTAEEFAPAVARFIERKAAVMAIFDEVPDLRAGEAKEAREYLVDLYKTLENPKAVKRDVMDSCTSKPGI